MSCSITVTSTAWPRAAALAIMLTSTFTASAQTFPAKPVRIVVPYPPGGGTDIVTRNVAVKLGEIWGQQVIVENRAGANGMIGSELVVKSAPDGYTLAVVVATHPINPSVYAKLPYNTDRDFTPITLIATSPFVMMVHPGVPARTVREVIELARSKPGSLTFGSSEYSSRLAGELFKNMAKIDLLHVPYKGGGPMMTDMLGGHLAIGFTSVLSALPHVKSGKLVMVAAGSPKRSPIVPEVPTIAEAGLPGYEANAWYGVFGPAAMPADTVNKIQRDIARVSAMPDLREKIVTQGGEPVGNTPAEFASFVKSEMAKWSRVVKDANIQPE